MATAQLRQDQVLLVYDSRIPDSLAVAEFYAGSAKVPGGSGTFAGARPGVRVMNLANDTASSTGGNTIAYTTFISAFRTPIRRFLNDPVSPSDTPHPARNIITKVRCLVTTRGLPHRVQDINIANAGDVPNTAGTLVNAGNYTACALDSELTLLWQNLSTGEANGGGDSKADGAVLNPFWRSTLPINAFDNRNIAVAKAFSSIISPGVGWHAPGTGAAALRPGDIYIVSRLDCVNVQTTRDMISRAAQVVANVNTAAFVLDEGFSPTGVTNTVQNDEFDNQGPTETWGGDDYEQTRDVLTTDRRFLTANIKYNGLGSAAQFIVGPRVVYTVPAPGIVVPDPILLLTTEGANHVGGTPSGAGAGYPFSFNYAPGAAYNTMESYNGRAFGGLTNGFGQGNASDFLSSGGTFAACNVWEPFTFSVADSNQIVRNLYLGNFTWGEAAFSSLPVLSFQQMIVGDPLARIIRSCDDANADLMLTLDDLHTWNLAPTDINRSGSVTYADRRLLETSTRGYETLDMAGGQR
ncbi:MAG: hypothetical protein ACKVS8_04225 [Phycisphaerales bacterium]